MRNRYSHGVRNSSAKREAENVKKKLLTKIIVRKIDRIIDEERRNAELRARTDASS